MKRLYPPALNSGDTIGVFSPSSWVEKEEIEKSKSFLEKRDYKVFVHPQTYERHHQSAGTTLQKALAFQGLWQRDDIKAIWAAGGGNRCMHLTEAINFEKLKSKPKILIGFSDVTALLNNLTAKTGIVTFHGPIFKTLYRYKELDELCSLLAGKTLSCSLKNTTIVNHGIASGPLIGGNLSLFQYLPQTLDPEYCENSILFLEDCNEEISRIDRMLLQLKRLGVFNQITALLLGDFTPLKDTSRPYGFTLEDIVKEHTEGLNIPIVMDFPIGHGNTLYPLPVGAQATIDTKKSVFSLLETAVRPT